MTWEGRPEGIDSIPILAKRETPRQRGSLGQAQCSCSLISVVTLIMRLEFEEEKRAKTIEVRGLGMARAADVLRGATLTVEDDRQDYGEIRFITIGFLDDTMVVLAWTPRDNAYRIISMRKANDRERKLYGTRF